LGKVFYPQALIAGLVHLSAEKRQIQCALNVESCGLLWITVDY